jgi:hypothetical protein
LRNRYKLAIPNRLNPIRSNVEGSGTAVVDVTISTPVGEDVPKVRLLTTLPEEDKNIPTPVGVRENMKKSAGKAGVKRSAALVGSTRNSPT